MSNDIIKIADAKALKAMGMPLNMPVEKRLFNKRGTQLWVAVVLRAQEFLVETIKFGKNPTRRRYKSWTTAFDRLEGSVRLFGRYITRLSATDEMQAIGLSAFLEPVVPFLEEYAEVFDALENGHEVADFKVTVPDWVSLP